MATYMRLRIPLRDEAEGEVIAALLTEMPFAGFETADGRLDAWIDEGAWEACRAEAEAVLVRCGVEARAERVADRDWNEAWEQAFAPVDIEGRIRIRAPHHPPSPEGVLEVVVRPCRTFGTGHHATTRLMALALMDAAPAGRRGLDVGCGTGVLAIVAAKCGAARVDAVDIDPEAVASCRESIALSGVADRVHPIEGGVEAVAGRRYGFVAANIIRNTLVGDMAAYAAALERGGDLLVSGFLEADAPTVAAAAGAAGLREAGRATCEGWVVLHLRKEAEWSGA